MIELNYERQPNIKYCLTPNCVNEAQHQRRYCARCRNRKFRRTNPIQSTFNKLKSNAKRRGINFNLTLREWEQFCEKTNYIKLRGQSADSYSVDRVNPLVGYELSNLQLLTVEENGRKGVADKRLIFAKKSWCPKQPGDPF
jgi:hypothetical protein